MMGVEARVRCPGVVLCSPNHASTSRTYSRVTMARHHPDLIMCRKQPGIAIGRLCAKCTWRGAVAPRGFVVPVLWFVAATPLRRPDVWSCLRYASWCLFDYR